MRWRGRWVTVPGSQGAPGAGPPGVDDWVMGVLSWKRRPAAPDGCPGGSGGGRGRSRLGWRRRDAATRALRPAPRGCRLTGRRRWHPWHPCTVASVASVAAVASRGERGPGARGRPSTGRCGSRWTDPGARSAGRCASAGATPSAPRLEPTSTAAMRWAVCGVTQDEAGRPPAEGRSSRSNRQTEVPRTSQAQPVSSRSALARARRSARPGPVPTADASPTGIGPVARGASSGATRASSATVATDIIARPASARARCTLSAPDLTMSSPDVRV